MISIHGYGQDTLTINDESLESPISYGARDSIISDIQAKQVHLYGNAFVEMDGVDMKAGYILIDLDKNEMLATYAYDKDSNRIEIPVFTDGGEEITAYTIKYNLDTEKAYIEEVKIVQDEIVLYMGEAKKHPNDHIHFKKGRFTTCDLPEPHYHFQLSKAVMIPEERIVTGPMNLWIAGVPTPLGLPFSVIPQQKERTHGLLFPTFAPISIYGFGLNDLGYYIPINDQVQTSVYGSIYSRGSWGLKNNTVYNKRYKFNGDLTLGFMQFKRGFPDSSRINNFSINWTHQKSRQSSPYWQFNSNVNFRSDNNSKNNLDPANSDIFKNTLASDINLNRLFPGKPFQINSKLSMRQNSTTQRINLESPIIGFNTTQILPFKNVRGNNMEIVKRIGFRYSYEFKNVSQFADSLLRDGDIQGIGNEFMSGMNHRISLQTTGGLFKNILKISPTVTYSNQLNFQQIEKSYDALNNSTVTDTINKAGLAQNLSFGVNATTNLYSYYKYVGKRNPLLRHIATPSIGFTYQPSLNPIVTDSIGVDMQEISYSPFENSVYRVGVQKTSARLTFGLRNTFELKQKAKSDTVEGGFSKIRIIDALTINGNYDFMKDSMQLSNLSISMRTSPKKWLNFVANASFSPYDWNSETGKDSSVYAISSRGSLGRIVSNDLTTTFTITSKQGHQKIQENKENLSHLWNSDLQYFALHPEYLVDFDIPWKVNISHYINLSANRAISDFNPDPYVFLHTLTINGDVSFTKRWKVSGTLNNDLKTVKVTNAMFTLTRDMHCWNLSFRWTPVGTNKSFLLTIRNTSSIFGDAKLDFRKPPAFL